MDLEYEKFIEYKKLIEDKRICIVGPSPILIGKNLGELIDSYDIVVRVNYSIGVPIQYQNDYGFKNDVWYICGFPFLNFVNVETLLEKKIKFICFKSRQRFFEFNGRDKINCLCFEDIMYCDDVLGLLTTKHILTLRPKELFVAGFSFYTTEEHYLNGITDYFGDKFIDYVKENNIISNPNIHNLDYYRNWFKEKVNNNEIILDDESYKCLFRQNKASNES